MREKRTLHINLGQDVVGNQPELVPSCPYIGFGLRRGERGETGLRLGAHPPLANWDEGETGAAGRRGAGAGTEAEEREGSRPGCLEL